MPEGGSEHLTYRQALIAAQRDAMEDDPSVLLLGEDVAAAGGVFKTSEGLLELFGPDRVIDTPICENGFTGAALGMALVGLRPIVEIMFSDFLPTAADAIVNELPKSRFMSGGKLSAPVTIRSIGGATGGFGSQHSATGESWFIQTAGLRVAVASTPASAYTVLRQAIADDNPVLVFEHKALYQKRGPVERGLVPTDHRAEVVRAGTDITIVSSLLMLHRSLEAADALEQLGVSPEVIDIRWIRPLDHATIRTSAARTGAVLVVAEEPLSGSWGSAVLADLAMQPGGPLARVAFVGIHPDIPVPFSPPLEAAVLPRPDDIVASVQALLDADDRAIPRSVESDLAPSEGGARR